MLPSHRQECLCYLPTDRNVCATDYPKDLIKPAAIPASSPTPMNTYRIVINTPWLSLVVEPELELVSKGEAEFGVVALLGWELRLLQMGQVSITVSVRVHLCPHLLHSK